jgi:hypothetical protein
MTTASIARISPWSPVGLAVPRGSSSARGTPSRIARGGVGGLTIQNCSQSGADTGKEGNVSTDQSK